MKFLIFNKEVKKKMDTYRQKNQKRFENSLKQPKFPVPNRYEQSLNNHIIPKQIHRYTKSTVPFTTTNGGVEIKSITNTSAIDISVATFQPKTNLSSKKIVKNMKQNGKYGNSSLDHLTTVDVQSRKKKLNKALLI